MDVTAEYERKLEAPDGFELPELGGSPLETRVFTSVYYDVADGSLARAGITLRRRTERGLSVWQLKLPSADARLELEEPGGPTEPPEEMQALLVAHLRHGPVPQRLLQTQDIGWPQGLRRERGALQNGAGGDGLSAIRARQALALGFAWDRVDVLR